MNINKPKDIKVGAIIKKLTEDGIIVFKVLPNKSIQIIQMLTVVENKEIGNG